LIQKRTSFFKEVKATRQGISTVGMTRTVLEAVSELLQDLIGITLTKVQVTLRLHEEQEVLVICDDGEGLLQTMKVVPPTSETGNNGQEFTVSNRVVEL